MKPAQKEATKTKHRKILREAWGLKDKGMLWGEVARTLDVNPSWLSQLKALYEKDAVEEHCLDEGMPINKVDHGWFIKKNEKGERFSLHFKNQEEVVDYDDIRDDLIKEMKKYAPKYSKPTKKKIKEPHLLVIDPADIHIGKLATIAGSGDVYDHKIATSILLSGIGGLLEKSRGFEFNKIMLVVGNDILHTDTTNSTTTGGTYVQTSLPWHEAFKLARGIYVQVIEQLAEIAPVEVVYNPSNHDYMTGYMLTDALMCWFNYNKNVSFDGSIRHRKYTVYGQNLICTSHGDGVKENQLPLVIAQEASEVWGQTKYRYAYLHHIHHKRQIKYANGQDYVGVSIEYLRSPSAPDEWHDKMGYVGTKKAIEAFVHHPEHGQVMRITEHVEFKNDK